MRYGADDLGSGWCSRRDCSYALADLEQLIGDDGNALDRAIESATGEAQSVLRGRWPIEWPFADPPREIREKVAVLAVDLAVRPVAISRSMEELAEALRLRRKEAWEWLTALGQGRVSIEQTSTTVRYYARGTSQARGEMGFTRRG